MTSRVTINFYKCYYLQVEIKRLNHRSSYDQSNSGRGSMEISNFYNDYTLRNKQVMIACRK